MAKDKKDKKKHLSSDALHEMGGVNFTMDDVRAVQNKQDDVNAKAYDYMVEAMAVSANYMGDTITDEGIRMDDVYPTTLEETLAMDELLDKSERALKDENDEEYNRMITELRGIVGWSRRRHFNFSWGIIFGTLITVIAVVYLSGQASSGKAVAKADMVAIDNWDVKTDTITLEAAMDSLKTGVRIDRPIYYKARKIKRTNEAIATYQVNIEQAQASVDTATTKDNIKYYKEKVKENEKYLKREQDNLKEISGWSLKDAKKDAYKDAKAAYRAASVATFIAWIFGIIFILLIPLYIFANHSWGYVITKHREESELLDKIKTWGYSIAAGLFGAAAAMEYLPGYKVTTYYSNGSTSTHHEENGANYIILAIKIGLLILALVIVAIVSTGILIYSTIVGLKRNYDWKEIYAQAKEGGSKAADLAGKALDKGAEMVEKVQKDKKE
ncbi:MAG: hypothetical protein IJS13_08705 [Paludibacteraceae bacterium]|nr:hypothetical protein [Paludibacteraceae bacterium]